jgi:SAM-dependent methyltransferase
MHGGSFKYFKEDLRNYLMDRYPPKSEILDVGAGGGTYALLLGDYFELDAVEVYKPTAEYIEGRYRKVFNQDIRDFEYDKYDIVLFGDVLEHLEVEEAQKVLEYAIPRCEEVIVAVPYQYKQGEVNGNVYEIHKQDDLTPEIMKERYPYLSLLFGNDEYGYYVTQ